MKQEIKQIIIETVKKLFPEIELENLTVEETQAQFGDYSTNIAMLLAKKVEGAKRNSSKNT